MPLCKFKGINLKSIKVGEADKIITIFSREEGKISAIGKGARRPGSKFGARLEPFAYNDYLLAEGKSLYIISQVETIDNFHKLREDQGMLEASFFLSKLLNFSTEDGQKNAALFDLTLEVLKLIKNGCDPITSKLIYEILLMDVEGFFPNITGCVKCKKQVKKEPEHVTFSVRYGGLYCSSCASLEPGGVLLPYSLVKLMSAIKGGSEADLLELKVEKADADKLNRALLPYISDHIGRDIRNW
jgi:DNA repair protein RecO (recombination protein O)